MLFDEGTARGSRGGALPGKVGAALEDAVREAIGALPGVTVHRNDVKRATLPNGTPMLTGIGGLGAPDLMAEVRGPDGQYRCLWLECKANSGRPRPDQKVWHAAAAREGRHVLVVKSVGDVLAAIARIQAGAMP